jgi:hypothetical protein
MMQPLRSWYYIIRNWIEVNSVLLFLTILDERRICLFVLPNSPCQSRASWQQHESPDHQSGSCTLHQTVLHSAIEDACGG